MAIERIIAGKECTGCSLLRSQKLLNKSMRDIVDESDENFIVKFELVYTMGIHRPTDHSPDRWTCIQDVLEAKGFLMAPPSSLMSAVETRRSDLMIKENKIDEVISVMVEKGRRLAAYARPSDKTDILLKQGTLTTPTCPRATNVIAQNAFKNQHATLMVPKYTME